MTPLSQPMPALMLAFFNVNEEGAMYDVHDDMSDAIRVLMARPDDYIVIMLVTHALMRYLTDPDYDLRTAFADGMTVVEFIRSLTETDDE